MGLTKKKFAILMYLVLGWIIFHMGVAYFDDPMRFCIYDGNCVMVQDGCCPCNMMGSNTVISMGYREEWNEKIPINCKGVGCLAAISHHPSCYSEPVCESFTCKLKPLT